jgi:CDP-diacylglycerol--glycerol-3-phosphate 3-phosphatidyltransferase
VIKDKFGDRLDGWIHTIFPFLFKRQINPNALTVFGTIVCVGAAVAFGTGNFLVGGLLLAAGGLCDLVDGVVARHFDISTAFGAFLDSTLDRLVDMVVLLALTIHYAMLGDPATAVVAGVVLVASVLTSYTKARAEALDIPMEGGIIERGERIGILLAGALFNVMVPALWVLAVGATATVVQRFQSARRGFEGLDIEQDERHPGGGEHLAHGK